MVQESTSSRRSARRHSRRRGSVAAAAAGDLLPGRVDRERAGPDHGAEPAAHLAPPQDPGRGRPARPVPRGRLGVLSARPDTAKAPGWRGRCAVCCPTTTPTMRSTSGGWRRCARRAGARPSAISTGGPARWDSERELAVDGAWSRRAARAVRRPSAPASLLDIGTGTGRILQLLAGQVGFGLGIDLSHDMLAVARANLDRREARNCQVRHGDMYQLPLPDALVRGRDPASGAAFRRRSVRGAGRGRARAGAGRPAGRGRSCPPRAASGCATSSAIAGWASADEEMAGWFAELGLDAEPPRRLAGPELTVVIWAGPARAGRRRRRRDKLDERSAA